MKESMDEIKAAKLILLQHARNYIQHDRERFICLALMRAQAEIRNSRLLSLYPSVHLSTARQALTEHIDKMLGGVIDVESWLILHRYLPKPRGVWQSWNKKVRRDIQEYRIRWIDHMIEQVKRGEL